jgi:hypothetical protein
MVDVTVLLKPSDWCSKRRHLTQVLDFIRHANGSESAR